MSDTIDAWNRVVRITDSDTVGPNPNSLGFYGYDARGYRIIRQTYGTGAERIHNYFTSSWQCIEERSEELSLTPPITPVLSAQYV